MNFGDWINKIKISLRMDQQELAEALGFENRAIISAWSKAIGVPAMKANSMEKLLLGFGYANRKEMEDAFQSGNLPDPDLIRLRLKISPQLDGQGLVAYDEDMSDVHKMELRELKPQDQLRALAKAWCRVPKTERQSILTEIKGALPTKKRT